MKRLAINTLAFLVGIAVVFVAVVLNDLVWFLSENAL